MHSMHQPERGPSLNRLSQGISTAFGVSRTVLTPTGSKGWFCGAYPAVLPSATASPLSYETSRESMHIQTIWSRPLYCGVPCFWTNSYYVDYPMGNNQLFMQRLPCPCEQASGYEEDMEGSNRHGAHLASLSMPSPSTQPQSSSTVLFMPKVAGASGWPSPQNGRKNIHPSPND